MKPYYQEAGITIYHGDANEVIPQVKPRASMVFTSPPYNVGLKYKGYTDKRDDFKDWIHVVLKTCFDACEESARAYFTIHESMIFWMRESSERAGWTYGQLLTWCKSNLVGGAGKRITGDWNLLSEWIFLLRKGKRTAMLNDASGNTFNWFLESCPQSTFKGNRHRWHAAQMSLNLACRIIRRTPGETVLEPFCGSGTTLLACKLIGRKAIGVDIDESACEIAARRLAQEVLAL